MNLTAMTVVMAPRAMTVVAMPPARLADDGGVSGGRNGRLHTWYRRLTGGGGEAEDDGAADEGQRNDAFHDLNSPEFSHDSKVRRKDVDRGIQ